MQLPQRIFNLIQHDHFTLRKNDGAGDLLIAWNLAKKDEERSNAFEDHFVLTDAGKNAKRTGLVPPKEESKEELAADLPTPNEGDTDEDKEEDSDAE